MRRDAPDRGSPTEITLVVNGERCRYAQGTTVAALLAALELDPRMVVVEHNREILHDREQIGGRALADGDTLEIVHFVGGG